MLARCSISKASASSANADEWKSIDWNSTVASVRQLQMRIGGSIQESPKSLIELILVGNK
jgi:hypothetical protein